MIVALQLPIPPQMKSAALMKKTESNKRAGDDGFEVISSEECTLAPAVGDDSGLLAQLETDLLAQLNVINSFLYFLAVSLHFWGCRATRFRAISVNRRSKLSDFVTAACLVMVVDRKELLEHDDLIDNFLSTGDLSAVTSNSALNLIKLLEIWVDSNDNSYSLAKFTSSMIIYRLNWMVCWLCY